MLEWYDNILILEEIKKQNNNETILSNNDPIPKTQESQRSKN